MVTSVDDNNEKSKSPFQYESPVLSFKQEKLVSLNFIFYISISFLIGIGLTLVLLKIFSVDMKTFTSYDLINFTFSIALSGASIVLAIVAIDLSKKSEQLMLNQSNESILLQNKIFLETQTALQQIGKSTGVTEKRIEDIISGRVTNITESIASKMIDNNLISIRSKPELEDEIRQSILREVSKNSSNIENPDEENKRKERIKLIKEYQNYRNSILLGIANIGTFKSLKIGDGRIQGRGTNLFDGIFSKNDKKIGICTFSNENYHSDIEGDSLRQFFSNILIEILNKNVAKVYLSFKMPIDNNPKFKKEWDEFKAITKSEIVENIVILSGEPEEIISVITRFE
jgi:hypothetical protein